ncbi:sugar dehydratase [Imbroritus primus]|uniref:Sugar dehydratase n=1 Tax=Imbroritus primus TaxID=3058603 RepID=A0ACD3SQ04_9BURK|nr:sugar dehydratase [Burkholderiaceae bacterium PBA]
MAAHSLHTARSIPRSIPQSIRHAVRSHQVAAVCRTLVLVLCVSGFGTLHAQERPQEPTRLERGEAAKWLARIQKAAKRENYVGTLTFQRGSTIHSSRIQHFSDGLNNEYERLEMLDGKQREVLRQNSQVHTLIHEAHVVVVEQQEGKDRFPALLATTKGDVLEQYDMRHFGRERVAGKECEVFALDPRDSQRFAYRIWADKDSGLLIRAQTLGDAETVLEQIAFSQVDIGVPSGKQRIIGAIKGLSGWRKYDIHYQPANLADQGWQVSAPVRGFQKIREVRRPLNTDNEKAFEVHQVVFSDGLAGLSVFIEPVDQQRMRKEGIAAQGPTHIQVRRVADHWITVVGEVPASTVRQFAAAVSYRPAGKP